MHQPVSPSLSEGKKNVRIVERRGARQGGSRRAGKRAVRVAGLLAAAGGGGLDTLRAGDRRRDQNRLVGQARGNVCVGGSGAARGVVQPRHTGETLRATGWYGLRATGWYGGVPFASRSSTMRFAVQTVASRSNRRHFCRFWSVTETRTSIADAELASGCCTSIAPGRQSRMEKVAGDRRREAQGRLRG